MIHNLDEAIDRIKILECPTGEVENRVLGILEDYHVAKRNEVLINREEKLDIEGAEAYKAQFLNNNKNLVIYAQSGFDDYVAKVVDVKMK